MTKREHLGVTIECVQGDIACQPDMQAIVNAANAQLQIDGGVAGAIYDDSVPVWCVNAGRWRRFSPVRWCSARRTI